MLSREELYRIAAADEARLGVGSKARLQRHNEIMALCDAVGILPMCNEMQRRLCDGDSKRHDNAQAGQPEIPDCDG